MHFLLIEFFDGASMMSSIWGMSSVRSNAAHVPHDLHGLPLIPNHVAASILLDVLPAVLDRLSEVFFSFIVESRRCSVFLHGDAALAVLFELDHSCGASRIHARYSTRRKISTEHKHRSEAGKPHAA
jgi:hypothetical protein